jgi:hydrogenase-4 component F
MEHIKNVFKFQPFAAWSLILGAIAIIGMPISAIFLPKISILLQSAELSPFLLLGLLIVFLFVAASFGIFLIKLLSRKEEDAPGVKRYESSLGMKIPIIVLLAAVFALGVFFPQQLTNLLNSIVSELGIR